MFKQKVIDVSHWNGNIDWLKVKQSGVYGVIIKCGGSDTGKFYTDKKFKDNYYGAKSVGLHVGAYWFTGKKYSGVTEAEAFRDRLAGYQFDLPVYLDFEVSTSKLKYENTVFCVEFCNRMEQLGYFVGIYASDISGFTDKLNYDDLTNYTHWVARYSINQPKHLLVTHMWQFTSTGSISGISTKVDESWCYRDFPTIIIGGHYNGY